MPSPVDQRQAAFVLLSEFFPTPTQAGIRCARTGHALAEIAGPKSPPIPSPENPVAAAGGGQQAEPATLVLRVEGPMALEIQHASTHPASGSTLLGWSAVAAARAAGPLSRRNPPKSSGAPSRSGGGNRGKPCRRSRTKNCGPRWRGRRLDQAKLRPPPRPGLAARHCHNCVSS